MDTLRDVKIGETVTVARVHGEGPVKAHQFMFVR